MDITSLLITLLLAALLLYLVVRLPLAILGNLRRGHRFRQGLAEALDDLRLSRMLVFLGINRAEYLHRQEGLAIRQHMQRCAGCEEKTRCDEVLERPGAADSDALGFCANIEDLKTIRDAR